MLLKSSWWPALGKQTDFQYLNLEDPDHPVPYLQIGEGIHLGGRQGLGGGGDGGGGVGVVTWG